ncbi:MAG: PilZ domain-containing protein [Bdellovibrionota bacterium]
MPDPGAITKPTPDTSDRREQRRLPAQLRAVFKLQDGAVGNGLTSDLSEGGVFLVTARRAPVGSRIFLRIHLGATNDVLKIVGTIRRHVPPAPNHLSGMGVRFDALYGDHAETLREFLSAGMGRKVDENAFGHVTGSGTLKFIFEPDTTGKEQGEDSISLSHPRIEADVAVTEKNWPMNLASASETMTADPEAQRRLDEAARRGMATKAISDEQALRELNFSYPAWLLKTTVKMGFYLAIPLVIYFFYLKAAAWMDRVFSH